MKPRCTWTGFLKLSLLSIPIRVFTATSTTDKITFNQLHKNCHQRIRQKLVCPAHGEVVREDVVRGYEYASDKYVIVDETDLEAVRLETAGAIELLQFVSPEDLDPLFLDSPYYLTPDGPVAEESFRVLIEALGRAKRVGIGRVVLSRKERPVAVRPQGKGLVLFTLRYVSDVRPACLYFEDLSDGPVDAAQVALAKKLIESKSGALDLANFTDRYQAALLELVKAKIDGTEPVVVQSNSTAPAISLMEALRQSVGQIQKKPNQAAGRKNVRSKVGIAA